jgi:predicted Kef-type K+ transport protein
MALQYRLCLFSATICIMIRFNRIFWPLILAASVVYHLSAYFIFDPIYSVNTSTNIFSYLFLLGVVGSIASILSRYGFKRSRPLLITWSIALISAIGLVSDDGLGSVGFIIPLVPSVLVGAVMIFVYAVRNPK